MPPFPNFPDKKLKRVMTFNLSEQQEKSTLQQVIGIINDTIQNTDTSVKEHVETFTGIQRLYLVKQRYRSA